MNRRWPGFAGLLIAAAMALPACAPSSSAERSGRGSVQSAGGGDRDGLQLVASFYPLQWVAQQVAGRGTLVTSLTKAGVEPHDLELSPREVAEVAESDLVIYLKGFQPAVDAAVDAEASGHGYEVSAAADLNLRYTPIAERERQAKAGATDPHFWLDPIRLGAVADALAVRLGVVQPGGAATYRSNAAALRSKLAALDRAFTTGLSSCASRDLVTSHNAFGYLAQRYGFIQVGITGLNPEGDPKPADLAAIAKFVTTHRVRTIYFEAMGSPAVARTVATETGATTALLDPIEGLTRESAGSDYLSVMRSNLATIRTGQQCR